MDHVIRHTKRVVIGILGSVIVLVGIVLIPYPGPGWLVVFSGLAVLATEFHWARRLLDSLHSKYDHWAGQLRSQRGAVKASFFLATAMLVIATVWVVNGFGIIGSILHLNEAWLTPPFMR